MYMLTYIMLKTKSLLKSVTIIRIIIIIYLCVGVCVSECVRKTERETHINKCHTVVVNVI